MRNDIAARAREIALTLTAWPSVTGSPDEAAFAPKLARYLAHFDTVWTSPIPDDARRNVFALKRGRSNRTIVLTGHFDVVPVNDYGALEPLAFAAERLLPEIVARLRRSGESPLALADFESGEFLPGRGLLDMKAGLAAGIAAMEAYSGDASLLFLAVSDEEERSAGARAAAPLLAGIAQEHGLDIALVINLDAISDQGDGAVGRSVALGSVGKQLVTAFVVGKEAHACYPEDGANAAYLGAELLTEFELAPELAETSGAEVAAPPTALHAKDLKSGYNVTTPAQSWLYWNTLQHRRSAQEVFDTSLVLARRAMARAARKLNRDVPVMSYAELSARVPQHDVMRIAAEVAAHGVGPASARRYAEITGDPTGWVEITATQRHPGGTSTSAGVAAGVLDSAWGRLVSLPRRVGSDLYGSFLPGNTENLQRALDSLLEFLPAGGWLDHLDTAGHDQRPR